MIELRPDQTPTDEMSDAQPEVSAECREQVRAMWTRHGGSIYRPLPPWTTDEYRCTMDDPNFWSFVSAFDAQAKAEADARVETMRERAARVIRENQEAVSHTDDGQRRYLGKRTQGDMLGLAFADAIEALPIEGDAEHGNVLNAVETARESAARIIEAIAADLDDGAALEALHEAAERVRAMSIEGDGR